MSLARILVTAVFGVVLGAAACGDADETNQGTLTDLIDCPPEGCATDAGANDDDAGPLIISRCTDGEVKGCTEYIDDPAGGTSRNCYYGFTKCVDGEWGKCDFILDADNQPVVAEIDEATGNVVDPATGEVLLYADGSDAGI